MTEQDTSFERHQLEEYLQGFIAMQNYHLDLDHRHRQIEASIETGGPLSWADEQQYDPAFIGGRNAAAVDTADNTPLEANLSQQSSTKRQPAYRARHH
ncbi:hypothetical protein P3T76_013405 [Phytophthora citrophthora]|uniref:Uncharacterized protein n=1 Tax=Phytophthora citrophthora TaxID=4793 RepID=A0AAD9G320_9STRA|nr:hypothetical protein P3T76_013405 [Phytophthora citrophthora]